MISFVTNVNILVLGNVDTVPTRTNSLPIAKIGLMQPLVRKVCDFPIMFVIEH
jgi:hypothetical protein